MTETKNADTRSVTYELEIYMDAPTERVWDALTNETDAWWLPDFRMVGEGSKMTFDANAGGRLVETKSDGGSLLWYDVHMVIPKESIYLVGAVAPDWGGPATTMLKLKLEPQGDGCVLKVHDAIFGHIEDENAQCLKDGWGKLFTEGLKNHVKNK